MTRSSNLRAPSYLYNRGSYYFNYNGSNRLTGITNSIGTAETYTFNYLASQPLYSPFNSQAFGNVTLMQCVSNSIPHTHAFEYGGNFGELTKVTFPYGGDLRWAYRAYTYFGGQMLREVQYRYLSKSVGAALSTYTFVREDSGGAHHLWAVVQNPGGTGEKAWWFNSAGLNWAYEDRPAPSQPATRSQSFTWTQDAAGTPYIGTVLTTLDPGTAYQAQTKTEQSLDTHGNVIWTKVYNYGDLSTPARTYNHTYLSGSDYTSRFIFNLVAASTVTPAGGAPVSILTNYYDTQTGACYPSWTHPANVTEWDPAYVGWAARFRGNVTLQQTASGSSCTVRDDTGAVIRKVDGAGRIVSSTMAAANNYAVPSVITGGGTTNTFTYTTFLGIASVTEPNGSVSAFSYDAAARRA